MSNVEFSIIIPVYNVEKYIDECINSILIQTYTEFEIILVDDGSLDSSGQICDSYTEKDARIKVIHKENRGLSSARNAGLEIAVGKYIIFVDSDDFWDDNGALKCFHERLMETDSDILVYLAKRFYERNNTFTSIINMNVERERVTDVNVNKAIYYLIKNNIYRAAAWNKVIRKSVIDKNSLRFEEGRLSEDMDWCGDLLLYAKRFDIYEKEVYCYRQQRNNSITSNRKKKLVEDKLYMCKKGYEQVIKLNDEEKKLLLASYYAYEYSVLLGVSGGIRDKDILNEIGRLKVLLKYDICSKVKKVKWLKKVTGYSLLRHILIFFVEVKR